MVFGDGRGEVRGGLEEGGEEYGFISECSEGAEGEGEGMIFKFKGRVDEHELMRWAKSLTRREVRLEISYTSTSKVPFIAAAFVCHKIHGCPVDQLVATKVLYENCAIDQGN